MTTLISSPPVVPSTEAISLMQRSNFSKSPFSGAQVSTSFGYSEWEVTLGFAATTRPQARLFMAWLDSLRGQQNAFTYRPYGSGVGVAGKTLSSTAFPTTNFVNVGGWSANTATGLDVGEYCQIGTQFFRIVSAPANADASGVAQVGIEPFVRTQYGAGTPVNFASPALRLRLSQSDDAPAVSRDPDAHYLPTLTCFEAR